MTDLDVAVVGAGIAGLALAHRLRTAGRTVQVFESAATAGGRTRCLRRDGYTIDTGAESVGVRGYPATWRLAGEVGLTHDDAPRVGRPIATWREGRAHAGLGELRGLVTGPLAPAAKLAALRLLVDTAVHRRAHDTDRPDRATAMTVRELTRRHHPDLHDYLIHPLLGCDTGRAAAGPLLGHLHAVGSATGLRSWSTGMDTLVRLLAARVEISTGATVQQVATDHRRARLVVDGTDLTARTVVLCVPAPVAAELHAEVPAFVLACEFQPAVKVICLLDRPLEPAGGGPSWAIAVPEVENAILAGITLDDRKNPRRVPPGRGMVTLHASPAQATRMIDATNDEIATVLTRQAARYLPGLASACRVSIVSRYRHGYPLPTPAAMAAHRSFTRRPPSPVEYAGDWCLLRPSTEAALRSAELTADRLVAQSQAAVLHA